MWSSKYAQGLNLGKSLCSLQQSWFIKLPVGDGDPPIAAKDEGVGSIRRESVQRSTSLQPLNQSWQGSASAGFRCREKEMCVRACVNAGLLEGGGGGGRGGGGGGGGG
ncbi:hypothetical protein EYF80_014975 [Liparis tanakae]|uniref:Uncharacterized protein n=1 Tax=Liparis tanakae TaxID=230148 RepID=A0A4Z2IBP9_9TELE|nr:hypothetical protein EYF80_014975 [Liparis tanakae]